MVFTLKSSFFSLCLCASVVVLFGCSRNEVPLTGAKPEAPKSPRVAQEIRREGPGMNAMPAPPEPPLAEPAAAPSFSGSVVLPDALKGRFKRGETLYVIARAKEKPVPVAVQVLQPDRFPVAFTLTKSDSMMGDALPGEADIIVRLDADGSLATSGPDDLVAGPVPAASGQAVSLTLAAPEKR